MEEDKTMTMTNAEWCIKNGYKFSDLWIVRDCLDAYIITISGKDLYKYITTNELSYLEVMLKWLDMEHKEQILDDAEKRYLKGVIRPFKDQARIIVKYASMNGRGEYIVIYTDECRMVFPEFEAGTMYKGMKPGHGYSLEELGL